MGQKKATPRKGSKPAEGTESKKPRRAATIDFGNGPIIFTHAAVNRGVPVVGELVGTFTTELVGRTKLEVVSVDAYIALPEVDVAIDGWSDAFHLAEVFVGLTLAVFDAPEDLGDGYGKLNRGALDAPSRAYRTTIGLALDLPNAKDGDPRPATAILRSNGTIARDGTYFGTGVGIVLSGWLAGAMFCCGHGKPRPAPAPAPPPPPPPPPPPAPAPTPTGTGNPFGELLRPPVPPPIEPGQIIGTWRVRHRCTTLVTVDTRTVGFRKLNIRCSGCDGGCILFRFPKRTPQVGRAEWSAVVDADGPVTVGPGGKEIREFDGQPNYYYACVCVTSD